MRNGCNLRRFFSVERYHVHMSFHRADDDLQRLRDRDMARLKVRPVPAPASVSAPVSAPVSVSAPIQAPV